jgi:heme/copper-type cytochrome/quinol oxidase subunit 1
MVLATIIRLEMAYPGAGILAGDSGQYLSIVTAHGVVMVFFMAMPLLFGFLGNFLLPTQMGVHDVAFPRMNSAAFWFLPASLLALCQLVCIDRRYQRMNCFNVRELQSLLRTRFFNELSLENTLYTSSQTLKTNINFKVNKFETSSSLDSFNFFNLNSYSIYSFASHFNSGFTSLSYDSNVRLSDTLNVNNFSRISAFNHPTPFYKIKTGNYLPESTYNANYSDLLTSINYKSVLGLQSFWFQSSNFTYLLSSLVPKDFNLANTTKLSFIHFSYFTSKVLGDSPLFSKTSVNSILLNNWISNLLLAQSKQLRVLNNWNNLKLSREGWRCRMLSARNQRSLYKRYVNENELIWVIEKNAKDLLPGWAMVTPFSSRTRYTLVGKTDIGIMIVAITLIASMISSANFLMTYRYLSTLNNRKMRDARSFFTETVIAASWMMVAANPMLILGLFMLISDRHWHTSFFDYSGGGDTVLFQHMFWFFGHPEVYIIILPCFGITNTLLSFYLRKRISARASLMYSLYTIAFLGFFVWGHHMYMVGLAHTTRMLYSTLTVMISVPAATKIMHWLVTFTSSTPHFEVPFILTLFFIFYFVSGGISGMSVAHTGMSILFHDTFYVIGHFHVMMAGSLMFAAFASFYFYLPSLFGVRYSRTFAYLHIFYFSFGQLFTVIPMMWLGYSGMPRRVLDYPAAMGGWHSLTTSAHIITISGILAFVIMLFDSLRKKRGYVIKTFGVGRYNTRLNFYMYQAVRNRYWISKHLVLLPLKARTFLVLDNFTNTNLEFYESTLFFYSFVNDKNFKKSSNWRYIN